MYRLGVDLGGTNIAVGVVDEAYRIVGRATVKTGLPATPEEIVERMAIAIGQAIEAAGVPIQSIVSGGIGSPGWVDPPHGTVRYASNLDFHDIPLAGMLQERVGLPFLLENDANAAAWGEYLAGVGRGTSHFVMLTLGTGVGGGIILNQRLYTGSGFAGSEPGHTVIVANGERCTCGRRGCLEAYASASALIRQTRAAMQAAPDSRMWALCGGHVDTVDGRTAFDAMRQGDETGRAVVEQYLTYVAIGVENLINLFQPNKVCLGGGLAGEGEALLGPIRAHLAGGINAKVQSCVVLACLGNDAGIIGAAYLEDIDYVDP